jgi:secernin
MCDTFAIGSAGTAGGEYIFGKNSDREPDEAQAVISVPARDHAPDETLRCTYIEIPQAASTYAIVLSKPFWMWGAEMGVNEKGVVIGNEALFTKIKPEKTPGLIGMDLVRLALERSDTADKAAGVIIELLQRYGQGGACGYMDKRFQYMNSYLIMDAHDIIVLETIGRDYALKHYTEYAAISNGITTNTAWDRSSFSVGTNIDDLNDTIITRFAGSTSRRAQNLQQLSRARGTFTVFNAFDMLRSHRGEDPFKGFNQDVCMHAAEPVIRKSQTTGSMVVALDDSGNFKIFVTVGSCPCLSSYKPFLPLCPPGMVDNAGPGYSVESYWWMHEAFHINAVLRYKGLGGKIAENIQKLDEYYCRNIPFYSWDSNDQSLRSHSHEAFAGAQTEEKKWMQEMKGVKKDFHFPHNVYWQRIARRRGVPLV